MKIRTIVLFAFILLVALLENSATQTQPASKFSIGGIASTSAWLPGEIATPLSGGGTNPTFNNRFVLLLNFDIDADLAAFASMESYQGSPPVFYAIGLNWRLSNSPVLLLRAGKFLAPFGNFLPRRYDSENPLIGRPIAYTYQHNLSASVLPETYDDLLATRGMGAGLAYPTNPQASDGMRFFWREAYVSGLQLVGELSRFRYSVAVTNGALSTGSNINRSDTFNFSGRLLYTPVLGLRLGASFSSGAYLDESQLYNSDRTDKVDAADYRQTLLGFDLNYSIGYFELWSEYLRNSYETPFLADNLGASGFSAEAKYKLNARFYLAARWSALRFDEVPDSNDFDADGAMQETWDANASQLELGMGYRIHRHGFAKISHRLNRTHNAAGGDPDDDVSALQLVIFF